MPDLPNPPLETEDNEEDEDIDLLEILAERELTILELMYLLL
jgi:hypothetical protein